MKLLFSVINSVIAFLFFCVFTILSSQTTYAALPPGFVDSPVFSGFEQPISVRFAPDGRVFVAEKKGVIKVFDNLQDSTPTVFADLSDKVWDFWDHGLLGLEVDPDFENKPYVYVLYSLQGSPGGRLSRLDASSNIMTGEEQVLLEAWCQVYPSHSVGSLYFGPERELYISSGDGASFEFADYGQTTENSVCNDPLNEGGALRSQDFLTLGDPLGYSGTILRVNPDTGEALPNNPLFGGSNVEDDRIIAHGLRNPFRITVHPITGAVYVADVGWNAWEEINVIPNPIANPISNFGWPCYEGVPKQGGYDSANIPLCELLYTNGGVTEPFYAYPHTGSASITGLAVYNTGNYPSSYHKALFYGDYSEHMIRVIPQDVNGNLDISNIQNFLDGDGFAVDLEIGPNGDLFYVDIIKSEIRRIQYFGDNTPPTVVISSDKVNGPLPLVVQFDGSESFDPDNEDTISFAWDLDGDGEFDDSTIPNPQFTYTQKAEVTVSLQVTDNNSASSVKSLQINPGNTAPNVEISSPSATFTYKVGDAITFTGLAVDPDTNEQLPETSLEWVIIQNHCAMNNSSECHEHFIENISGVSSGSFAAPDHEYPSYITIRLKATDSDNLSTTIERKIYPETVMLEFNTSPAGGYVSVGSELLQTPFSKEVIKGSQTTISATSPQTINGTQYEFLNWSDNGTQTHIITAPNENNVYTVTMQELSSFTAEYFDNKTLTGTPLVTESIESIDFDWGGGSPNVIIPDNNFSARFTSTRVFQEGDYKFTTQTDDGVRLYIDNNLVINKWQNQSSVPHIAIVHLTEGPHEIKMEYYENEWDAVAKLTWEETTVAPTTVYKAEYWNLPSTTTYPPTMPVTAPVFTENVSEIDFDWGLGSPNQIINPNGFIARFSKSQFFESGTYKFSVTSDDGIRLYIDNELVINQWNDHGSTTFEVEKTLLAGNHDIKVEYYENGWDAVVKLDFIKIGDPDAFTVEYFNNKTLSGTPVLTREELEINNNWGLGSPDDVIEVDNFSARWVKNEVFTGGTYEFTAIADDGVRVYVDNELIIDKWVDQSAVTHTATKTLTPGIHEVKFEYYENGWNAIARLSYEEVQVSSTIKIYAAGTPAFDIYPTIALLVNDVEVAQFQNIQGLPFARVFQEYTYESPVVVTKDQIKVEFINDAYDGATNSDRNVIIDRITVNGDVYQTEANTTYSTGTWSSENGCGAGYKSSEILHCGGFFQF